MNLEENVGSLEIQELFQVTAATISEWSRMGMPKRDRGLYNVADCVRWRMSYLQKKVESIRYSKDETITDLKKEMQKIQNRERLVKLAKLEGQLVPVQQAQVLWAEQVGVIVRAIEALPAQLNDLIGGDNHTFDIIRKAINATRRDIAATEIRLDVDIYAEPDTDQPGAEGEPPEAD